MVEQWYRKPSTVFRLHLPALNLKMSELREIQAEIQTNFDNLNDSRRTLPRILTDRRINSGHAGVLKFIRDMASSLSDKDAIKAGNLLEGIIADGKIKRGEKC